MNSVFSRLLLFLLPFIFSINYFLVNAAVGITAPSVTISTCTFPSATLGVGANYNSLGNIVIDEGSNSDFPISVINTDYTFTITAPANFEFLAGTGSVANNGQDFTTTTIVVTATSITITYRSSQANRTNGDDILTISGIKVRAITGIATQTATKTASSEAIVGLANGTVMANFISQSAIDNCLTFNGTTNYAEIADAASLDLTGGITLEAWIYPTSWQANVWEGSIINKEEDATTTGYMIRCGAGGTLNFNLGIAGIWQEINSAAGTLTLNTWQHVAATYNGANMYLYVNGVQVATKVQVGNIGVNNKTVRVGAWADGAAARFFPGKIDEVRIWNTALSVCTIVTWYNDLVTGSHPNYANLVGLYEMNTTTAGVLTGTIGANGTVTGATYGASSNSLYNICGGGSSVLVTSAQPNTTNVVPSATNQEILRIEVEVDGAMNATEFKLRTDGSTNVADITNAKIWFTGTSTTFATTTQFGSTIAVPPVAGTDMTFSGTQALTCGKNYFWLTYDIAAGAVMGDVVDAQIQSAVINAVLRTPTTSAPAGSRPINISYCASSATSNGDEEIFNVTFGTLNNSSTCATTGGAGSTLNMYSNYTGVSAPNVTQSSSVAFSVQIGTCGGTYGNAVKIFIDYNQDGDFADAGEEAYVSASSTSGPHTETGNITIPAGATLGNTRMRVVNVEIGTPASILACGTYTWGETEDYTINIVASGPMTFTSCTTTQTVTSTVEKCSTDKQIIGIEVVTTGSSSPLALTSFQINMNGSTIPGSNTNDVTNIHVYYTGTSSTFNTVGVYNGAGTAVAAGTITINGSQTLATGTNYFWIAYDINSVSATIGNVIDAQCTRITVAAVNQTPTVTSPAGSRSIIICAPSPGGVSTGLQTWIRADIGVTGSTPVTAWANQNTSGTAILVNGSPNLNTASTSYNYNPYVEFAAPVGTLSDGLAANRQFLKLNGYSDINGLNYTSLFFAFELDDLTRTYTHIGTVENVTNSAPVNGTFHGDANGATASILWETYDVSDFGTSAPAGTWRRNGLNITSNSVHTSQKQVLSANCLTGGSTTLNTFLGGQRDLFDPNSFAGHVRDWKGPCAEIIGYTTAMTTTERQKIDSYLAIKYGMTLTFNYLSTSTGTVYSVSAPYNNNIIGIGRDDVESLTQKQSHNDDDSVRIYLNTLQSNNAANTGTFASDISYIMTGATTGQLCTTLASLGEMPAPCLLYSRLEREWKVTKTNVTENFNMDIKLATCAAPGSVVVADLRFLVDDDGNFGNGGTTCYYNGDGSGIVISYSNPTITVSNISTAHIPNNSTRFVTIGSIQEITPLPTELLSFNAEFNDERNVDLTWSTASEINSDYFTVEKSLDVMSWEEIATVEAAGTSYEILNYAAIDYNPIFGNNYYRLKQTDFDGSSNYSDIRMVNLKANESLIIYPNPTSSKFTLTGSELDSKEIKLFNAMGQEIQLTPIANGKDIIEYSIEGLSEGVYTVQIKTGNEFINKKLIIIGS